MTNWVDIDKQAKAWLKDAGLMIKKSFSKNIGDSNKIESK